MTSPTAPIRRVLVISNDEIGESMAGPAIRAYELSRQVARHHHTLLKTPSRLLELTPEGYKELTPRSLRKCLVGVDVVMANTISARLVAAATISRCRVIVDAYCPVLFEAFEADRRLQPILRRSSTAVRLAQLRLAARAGDGYVCANERQRDLLIGNLAMAGRVGVARYDRDPTLRSLVATTPFGLPESAPKRTDSGLREAYGLSDDDFVVVWGGGIWDWFDPLTLVHAISTLAEHRSDVKLVFLGVTHPRPGFPQHRKAQETIELARELGVLDKYVFINKGWIPYVQRANYLLDGNLGVSANHVHLESRYAFRTRVLDYLWCELPIVCTAGDAIADLVDRENLGVTVQAENVEDLVHAIERLADDEELRESIRANLRRVKTSYTWEKVAVPLLRLIDAVATQPSVTGFVRLRRMLAAGRYATTRISANVIVVRVLADHLWRRRELT